MGTKLVCDECGKDIGEMDRTQVRSDSIAEGSIFLDLCIPCSKPVQEVGAFKKKRKDNLDKIKRNQEASKFNPGAVSPTAG